MGTLKRSELEEEIRKNLGGRTDLNDRLVRFLNIAQDRITAAHDFRELRKLSTTTTTADDKYIGLPSAPRQIYSLRLIDGTLSRKLTLVPARDWDRVIPYPEALSTGRPTKYTIWQSTIELYRIPDDTYTLELRWLASPTAFSSDSDVVSDFNEKDGVIIAYATSWAFASLGDKERAAYWYTIGKQMLGEAILRDQPYEDMDIAPGFEQFKGAVYSSDYWANPFIKGVR